MLSNSKVTRRLAPCVITKIGKWLKIKLWLPFVGDYRTFLMSARMFVLEELTSLAA
jgi:hypothetical protein